MADLRAHLLLVIARVRALPKLRPQVAKAWPELGFYDGHSGSALDLNSVTEVGDAVDDLTDIACDFAYALRLAEVDAAGPLDHLRFDGEIHGWQHVTDLFRHLAWLGTTS